MSTKDLQRLLHACAAGEPDSHLVYADALEEAGRTLESWWVRHRLPECSLHYANLDTSRLRAFGPPGVCVDGKINWPAVIVRLTRKANGRWQWVCAWACAWAMDDARHGEEPSAGLALSAGLRFLLAHLPSYFSYCKANGMQP